MNFNFAELAAFLEVCFECIVLVSVGTLYMQDAEVSKDACQRHALF